ncbi:hypothetical protein C1646_666773 [Rhizophagus diaphanus]|nr:hypothetical protein C1646_666773 [Rhizophagus diaphanus] [Rhizophagus sp. MUCL 43196]
MAFSKLGLSVRFWRSLTQNFGQVLILRQWDIRWPFNKSSLMKKQYFLIYDKDLFGDIKINSCEFFLALQENSHMSNCCHKDRITSEKTKLLTKYFCVPLIEKVLPSENYSVIITISGFCGFHPDYNPNENIWFKPKSG